MSERKQFDKWIAHPVLKSVEEAAWQAWQARADLAAEERRELVEAAWREGYSDGVGQADYGMASDVNADQDWLESNACNTLAKIDAQESSDE